MTTTTTQFTGKVILVTGAARGIGLAIARHLAARGATLALADIKEAELRQVQEQLYAEFPSSTVTQTPLDIRKSKNVEQWVSSTKERFGKIHGCVNNAAVMNRPTLLTTATDDDWDRVISVNLTGTFNCLRSQLKHIEGGGSIVNISSMAGLFGVAGMGPYVATKHAIIGLSRTAAKEVAHREIRVNVVCPGTTDTPMLAELNEAAGGTITNESLTGPQLFKRLGMPKEIASMVGFLLSDESSFITSSVNEVAGGYGS